MPSASQPWENPEARQVLDSMTEYFAALDRSYNIVFVNRALMQWGGPATADLVGKNQWDLWPDMRGSAVETAYRRAFTLGVPVRFEYHSPRSGVWLEVTAYPSGDYLHSYFRDITSQKQDEASRYQAERNYRTIVDALPQIAWVADVDGTASYFNARWYEYTGLDPTEEYHPSAIVHPDDLKKTLETRTSAYQHGKTYQTEVRLRRRDGEYRWHLTRAEPVRDQDGRVVRYVGTSTDIHTERLATQTLAEAEQTLRLMTDSVPILIAFVDREYRYQFVNRTFEIWFDKPRDQIVGRPLSEILGEDAIPRLRPYAERALGGEKLSFEWWVDYPSGRRFVQVTYVPRRVHGDEIDGFYVLTNDLTERVRTEEALRVSEQRYRAFVQAIPQVAWAAAPDGSVLFFNDRFYEYTGLAHDQGLGWEWAALIHPDDIDRAVANWSEAIQLGRDSEVDFRLRNAGGDYRWFLVRAVPVTDDSGEVVRWIGSGTDIQEQKAHTEALRFLFDLGNATREKRDPNEIMAVTARMLGEYLAVSRCSYCEVMEDEETLFNVHDWSPIAPTLAGRDFKLSQFGPFLEEPLRAGRTLVAHDVEREASPRDRDAMLSIQIKAVVATPLFKDGRLVAIMALHDDKPRVWTEEEVSLLQLVVERCWAEIERARAERGVRQSESRLRSVLEAATVGVIVNDRKGTFTYANPPLLAMLGYTREDLDAGRLSWHLIQAPDRIETDDQALDQLRASGSCLPYETELVARDGRRVPVYVGAAFIPDEFAEGLMGAAFVTDLTQLKAAQRELEALNEELDQRVRDRTAELRAANEALESYSYHVAHDLRAPLRAVVATSRMIEDDFGDELPYDVRHLLRRQVEAANKLGQLIDDLLKISRLSREEMTKEPIDFSEMAEDAGEEALSSHPGTEATLSIQPGLRAQADPKLLRLAILNLVENAVKYSPKGGEVRVGQREDGSYFVADQGIGIDMAYAHKIFEPFQRLHRDDEFKGTGIGLSNVAQIISRHGGKVWVESEPGVGSTFFFTLG